MLGFNILIYRTIITWSLFVTKIAYRLQWVHIRKIITIQFNIFIETVNLRLQIKGGSLGLI